jgi:trk system potassium uptake protein TrkA
MRFVVLGCGRVGAQLANTLSVEGHEVFIIDRDPKAFRRLSPAFKGTTVTGIGFDRNILIRAGIEKADGFASVSNADNSNIISALIAKRVFQVPKVVTRIYDPARATIYRSFGIPTISSTIWGANEIKEYLLYPELKSSYTFGNGEVEMLEFEVPPQLLGKPVRELVMPGQATVTCIVRLGQAMVPTQATFFEKGDLIYACVATDSLSRFRNMVGY